MKDNLMLLWQECIHRGIMDATSLGWRDMCRAIQQQEIDHWCYNNPPHTTLPDNMKKPSAFRKLSDVEFILKDN